MSAAVTLATSPASPGADSPEEDRAIVSVERINIAPDGKRFKAFFVTPGIINYSDAPVMPGKELLRKPTIDACVESFIGAPLTIGHIKTNIRDFNGLSHGTVDKVGFDADSGWHFAEGPIETDQARAAIREGWGVSAGTRVAPSDFGPGGTWLQNPYDREINKLKFHHLALVKPGQQPRYEDAVIRLNSVMKPTSILSRVRAIFSPGATAPSVERQNVNADSQVDVGDGKTAPLKDVLGALVERNNSTHSCKPGDHIECEGIMYSLDDALAAYRDKCAMADGLARTNAVVVETPEAKLAREKTEADAAALKETERLNAVETARVAEEQRVAAEADTARLAEVERVNAVAAEQLRVDTAARLDRERVAAAAEVERQNAVRAQGALAFNELGLASSLPAPAAVGKAPKTMEEKLAEGKRLF